MLWFNKFIFLKIECCSPSVNKSGSQSHLVLFYLKQKRQQKIKFLQYFLPLLPERHLERGKLQKIWQIWPAWIQQRGGHVDEAFPSFVQNLNQSRNFLKSKEEIGQLQAILILYIFLEIFTNVTDNFKTHAKKTPPTVLPFKSRHKKEK